MAWTIKKQLPYSKDVKCRLKIQYAGQCQQVIKHAKEVIGIYDSDLMQGGMKEGICH